MEGLFVFVKLINKTILLKFLFWQNVLGRLKYSNIFSGNLNTLKQATRHFLYFSYRQNESRHVYPKRNIQTVSSVLRKNK